MPPADRIQLTEDEGVKVVRFHDRQLFDERTVREVAEQIAVCLPVLHPFSKGHLLFLDYQPDTPMSRNQFGIAEPELNCQRIVLKSAIDIIFTPLVAFDSQGNRLGMGGGFYDRTLNGWHHQRLGPYPIGLAHDCQQVAHVPIESWDVPLPEILTPTRRWHWSL